MRFYEVNAVIANSNSKDDNSGNERKFAAKFERATEKHMVKSNNEENVFIVSMSDGNVKAGMMSNNWKEKESDIHFPWKEFGLKVEKETVEEIDSRELSSIGEQSSYNGLRRNCIMRMLRNHNLQNIWWDGFFSQAPFYCESLVPGEISKRKLNKTAKDDLWDEEALPEYKRIEQSTCSKFSGHPVHYMLCSDDLDSRAMMTENLLYMLHKHGRLQSRRYCSITVSNMEDDVDDLQDIDRLYKGNEGGAVVIRFRDGARAEAGESAMNADYVDAICECIRKYCDTVLTVLCFPSACEKEKKKFYEPLFGLSFVEIHQNKSDYADTSARLRKMAEADGLETDDELFARLKEDGQYSLIDIKEMYKTWKGPVLKRTRFPQYEAFESVRKKISKEKKTSAAYEELQEMIGLDSVKAMVDKARNFYKVQRLFKDKGRKVSSPAMHMVFTGNPGTAKTTVARLVARILRDDGILKKGHLVEMGRKDLIGQFVGQTAPKVKRAFEQAAGGVLFIDEAYSLCDGYKQSYGDEAIATIVQEMENMRDEVVVIFAGYPQPMEEFLSRNPGLRSRIAFNIGFEDYTSAELVDITRLIAKRQHLTIPENCGGALMNIYDKALKNPEFGNGRYARKMVEQALMNQANRIVQLDPEKVTDSDLDSLEESDFQYIAVGAENLSTRKIGF